MRMLHFMGADAIRITDNNGEDIGGMCSGFTYNATISAFELRAPKIMGHERTIPDLTKRGPLHMFALGARVALVHFEAMTWVPFEVDTDQVVDSEEGGRRIRQDFVVSERAVLRGARIEIMPPPEQTNG